MVSLSKIGIILISVFGFILLGLVAELYYFFWWKKKSNKNTAKNSHSKWLSFLFFYKIPISAVNSEELRSTVEANGHGHGHGHGHEQDLEVGINGGETLFKDLVEESVESELIRLHNLCGPPRFLFTIKEETKEDLLDQSEDPVKSSRSRNEVINDDAQLTTIEKIGPLEAFNHHGFNPLFESVRSSPPPKFKFLRDAEEKLIKRLVEEAEKRSIRNGGCFQDSPEEKDGSFIGFLKLNKERKQEIHSPISFNSKFLSSEGSKF